MNATIVLFVRFIGFAEIIASETEYAIRACQIIGALRQIIAFTKSER